MPDFDYGTAGEENTFTVKAVGRAGNTSEASNAVTAVCRGQASDRVLRGRHTP
jgi:hypothetical protein